MNRIRLITGVPSGFGYEMTKQFLETDNTVIGTVWNIKKAEGLIAECPVQFDCKILDMIDVPAIHRLVEEALAQHGKIDVVVSDVGYGLFGYAEEPSDEEVNHIITTNLTGFIMLIYDSLPHLRTRGGGGIVQMPTYGGQVTYTTSSTYHATRFGIEGFCEAVVQETTQFCIGVTLIEPGGVRTKLRYGSVKVAKLMSEYESYHGFLSVLDASKGLASGDPAKVAEHITKNVNKTPAPLRMVLGSQVLKVTIDKLEEWAVDYKTQTEFAVSMDIIW